jgi:hypothetical protein
MNEKEYLLAKADGVKDCVKWLEKEIKEQYERGYKTSQMREAQVHFGKYKDELTHQANLIEEKELEQPKPDVTTLMKTGNPVLALLELAKASKATLMGDDMVGFKYIGKDGEFWNKLLKELEDEDYTLEELNMTWLKENDIPFADYDNTKWSES